MKGIIPIFVAVLLGTVFIQSEADEPEKQVFKLVDGYYQNGNIWPVHLTHEIEKQRVWLGDSVTMYVSLGLNDGVENPCDRRGEVTCRFDLLLETTENEQPKTFRGGGMEFRIDQVIGLATSVLISRKAPLGPANVSFIVSKDGKELYALRIPVEVK